MGAFTAGLGLVLTAVSTFFGVLIAQDQLKQSEDSAEDQIRAQAAQVVLWERYRKQPEWIVANHSRFPLVGVRAVLSDGEPILLSDLPGCMQMAVGESVLTPGSGSSLIPESGSSAAPPFDTLHHIAFTGINGRKWLRAPHTGELRQYKSRDKSRFIGSPALEPIPHCGSGGSASP